MEQPKHQLFLILTLLFSTATVESEYLRPLPRKTLAVPWYSISKAPSSYPQQVNQPHFHSRKYHFLFIPFSSFLLFISLLITLQCPISFVLDWVMGSVFFLCRVIFSKSFSIPDTLKVVCFIGFNNWK